ncbi:MAG: nucleotidyltransferase domain-containing protein, partial [Heliobacteriaceae bacterium]|jgi:predicted nucleotidyltransferase|nr:nucleotidyltransferase domain-containing protein [Heliobacteriaceae bacterium]
MKAKIKRIVQELRTALQNAIDDFEGLYLFGSQATGKATKDSDIDIVILFKNKRYWQPLDYHKILSRISYEYDADLDTHPMTRKELERNYYFHKEVVNKGIFYGKTE